MAIKVSFLFILLLVVFQVRKLMTDKSLINIAGTQPSVDTDFSDCGPSISQLLIENKNGWTSNFFSPDPLISKGLEVNNYLLLPFLGGRGKTH